MFVRNVFVGFKDLHGYALCSGLLSCTAAEDAVHDH